MGFIPGIRGWLNIDKPIHMMHHINEMKDKNLIISIDIEKAFEKTEHSFVMKTQQTENTPQTTNSNSEHTSM